MYSKLQDISSIEANVKFCQAPFIQSKVHKTPVQLIKVPKYVADLWKSAEHESVVGVLKKAQKHEGNELFVVTEDSTESNRKIISVFDEKRKPNSNLFVLQPKLTNEKHADICGFINKISTYVPQFNTNYHEILRKRHREQSVFKGRTTTEETRQEEYDSSKTLFQYYNPRNQDGYDISSNANGSNNRKGNVDITSQRAAKSKQKKIVTMTEDSLRMRIFQLFEKAGDEGLTLKGVVTELDQPLNFVKNVIEELGEQKRRTSDRRVVYFLKDHYSSSVDKVNN